ATTRAFHVLRRIWFQRSPFRDRVPGEEKGSTMRRIGTASVGLAVAGAIGVLLWAWRRGGGHRKSVWLGPRKGREAALRVAATELGLSTSIRRSVQLIAEYA